MLWNPTALSSIRGVPARAWLAERLAPAEVATADEPGRIRELADAALREGGLLALAGGDGLVHRVVNALAPDFHAPTLGLVPLGTGNDLARSLGIPLDPAAAARVLREGDGRSLDVGRAIGAEGRTIHFANVALVGFGADVEPSPVAKRRWGDRSYALGALRRLSSLSARRVRVESGGEAEDMDAYLVAVANGRFLGGGIRIAPRARLDDGRLDLVVVRRVSLPRLARAVVRLLRGEDDPALSRRRAAVLRVELPGEWSLNLDGERPRLHPGRFEAVPGALRMRTPRSSGGHASERGADRSRARPRGPTRKHPGASAPSGG